MEEKKNKKKIINISIIAIIILLIVIGTMIFALLNAQELELELYNASLGTR